MSKYPSALLNLIAYLKKLPGVGSKTAERFAFQLLNWQDHQLADFADHIQKIKTNIRHCPECHCLTEGPQCEFCDPNKRDTQILCIISSPKDLYQIEDTRTYRGLYHVLGGLLSPLDGRTPQHLRLELLKSRIESKNVKEIIIALDSTLEGDATALYLKDQLRGMRITRLAFGLPLGSSLDFVDGGTLARAFAGRQSF